MSTKRRILFITEFHQLSTGFAKMAKYILNGLTKKGNVEVAELATYTNNVNPAIKSVPWKVYGARPDNEIEAKQYGPEGGGNANEYGKFRLMQAMQEFKPDILVTFKDPWMTTQWLQYERIIENVIWIDEPCVDGEPSPKEWVSLFKVPDHLVAYSEYARDRFVDQFKIDPIAVIRPGVDCKIYSPKNKKEMLKKFGLPEDIKLLGVVARNQIRKRFPETIEGYALFKKKYPEVAKKVKLYFHTCWSDVGFALEEIAQREGVLQDILTTYVCASCKTFYPSPFYGDWTNPQAFQGVKCKNCQKNTAGTCHVQMGVSEENLAEIINLFYGLIHLASREAWGLPIGEAKACGVPVLTMPYNVCKYHIKDGGAIEVSIQDMITATRNGLGQKEAFPNKKDLAQKINKFVNLKSFEYDNLSQAARKAALLYDWDLVVDKWDSLLTTVPIKDRETTWNKKQVEIISNGNKPPTELNNSDFVLWCYKEILNIDILAKTKNRSDLDKGFNDWMRDLSNGRTRENIENYFRQVAFVENDKLKNPDKYKKQEVTIDQILDPKDEFRILYTMPQTAGDVIVSTAVIDSIKKKYPKSSIYFSTDPKYFELLKDNPNIKKYLPVDPNIFNYQLPEGICDRKGIFDISFTPSIVTQQVMHFIHNGHGPHFAKTYANMCDVELGKPFIKTEEFKIPYDKYITLHTTSNQVPKNYDRWKEVIENLDLPVVQIGGQQDKPIPGVKLYLMGKLNWNQSADVIKNAILHLGVDAAPAHVAGAVETTSITLFGGTWSEVCKPLGNKSYVINPKNYNGCLGPCHLQQCIKPTKCINNIEPEEVLIQIKKLFPEAIKKEVEIEEYIYKGAFPFDDYIELQLTENCNYKCGEKIINGVESTYCCNTILQKRIAELKGETYSEDKIRMRETIPVERWNEIVKEIHKNHPDLPINLAGGEPTLYKGWEEIIARSPETCKFRIISNLSYKIDWFLEKILPLKKKIVQIVPSFHPRELKDFESGTDEFIEKCKILIKNGFRLDIGGVTYPEQIELLTKARDKFLLNGLRLRLEAFWGHYKGKLYPSTPQEMAVSHVKESYENYKKFFDGKLIGEEVSCRVPKLLVASDGSKYNCHTFLYQNIKSMQLPDYKIDKSYRRCTFGGTCHVCESANSLIKKCNK